MSRDSVIQPGAVFRICRIGVVRDDAVPPSGAPLGKLIGETCKVVGWSQTYNNSVVVDVGGRVYDIPDENLIP